MWITLDVNHNKSRPDSADLYYGIFRDGALDLRPKAIAFVDRFTFPVRS